MVQTNLSNTQLFDVANEASLYAEKLQAAFIEHKAFTNSLHVAMNKAKKAFITAKAANKAESNETTLTALKDAETSYNEAETSYNEASIKFDALQAELTSAIETAIDAKISFDITETLIVSAYVEGNKGGNIYFGITEDKKPITSIVFHSNKYIVQDLNKAIDTVILHNGYKSGKLILKFQYNESFTKVEFTNFTNVDAFKLRDLKLNAALKVVELFFDMQHVANTVDETVSYHIALRYMLSHFRKSYLFDKFQPVSFQQIKIALNQLTQGFKSAQKLAIEKHADLQQQAFIKDANKRFSAWSKQVNQLIENKAEMKQLSFA